MVTAQFRRLMLMLVSESYDWPTVDSGESRRQTGPDQMTLSLLEAAAEEFVRRGYDAARVSDIARRAGVTSGAVYARWRNKSEVVVAALDYTFKRILPDQKLEDDGDGEVPAPRTVAALGARLLLFDKRRDVMAQVFGSARNNAEIQECLKQFLNEEAAQLSRLIDKCKDEGSGDPDLSTAAISLVCQGAALGIQLLLSVGLDDSHVPSRDEWNALLNRLASAVTVPEAEAP